MLIEDVVSRGGAIIDALEKLRADGLPPTAALCVVDRETGGSDAPAAIGLAHKSRFTFAQVESGTNEHRQIVAAKLATI